MSDGFVKPEETEPEVTGFEFYFDAFRELSTSRPVGFGFQSIPFTAIVEYFRIYELSDFEEFIYIIRKMDNVFIEMNASKNEGNKKDGSKPNTRNPSGR